MWFTWNHLQWLLEWKPKSPWLELYEELHGKTACVVHFSSQTTIDQNCLLPLTVCSDGGLLAVPRRHLRRVTPTYTEKWLALPASKSIQNVTFPCTLPWRLIKHSLIRCLPLVWIGWGCCPAQADGADVRKNRKSPVSWSDEADSSVNTLLECSKGTCAALNSLGVWVHPQLGTNQHLCL